MAKKRTVNNDIFGMLTHEVGNVWKRPLELNIFGREWTVSLMVDIDPKDGIEEKQISAYNAFTENEAAVVTATEDAIFRYYQSICKEFRARIGISDPKDARVPLVKLKSGVFRLVELVGVTFPYARQRPTFGILCECTWEEEHGLGVRFEDGKLVNVGFQDIVL